MESIYNVQIIHKNKHYSPCRAAVLWSSFVYVSCTWRSSALLRLQQSPSPPTQSSHICSLSPSVCCGSAGDAGLPEGVQQQHASLVVKKGWLWWSRVVYWWSAEWTRERRELWKRWTRVMSRGMWCENKWTVVQTVEPTMVCQSQVFPRFMCLLYKHRRIVYFLRSSFPTVWPMGWTTLNPRSLRIADRVKVRLIYVHAHVHITATGLPLQWTSGLYSLESKPKQWNH